MIGRTNAKSAAATGDWIRPSDWLDIDSLVTAGEQKTVGLYAIYPNNNTLGMTNTVAFTVTGNHTIDWGDGSALENVNSNVQAQHTYDYDLISNTTYCTRGYRQVRITITPQSGQNITNLQFGKKHSAVFGRISSQWLDINISGTHLTTFSFSSTSYANLLEKVKIYQVTSALISLASAFQNTPILKSFNYTLNTGNVTSTANCFNTCGLEKLDISSLYLISNTNMTNMFFNMPNLKYLNLNNLKTGNNCIMALMFGYSGNSLIKITFKDADFSKVTNMNQTFTSLPLLQDIDLSSTNISNVANVISIIPTSGSLTKCRLPGIKLSFSIANNPLSAAELNLLFGDLYDLTGQPTQTITITGCLGAATCDKTIARNKNWTVIG